MVHRVSRFCGELSGRIEMRWLLNTYSYHNVYTSLSKIFSPITYSKRPWTRTLYLNNDAHDVPWEMNIRFRRYFREPLRDSFHLSPGKWTQEIKHTLPNTTQYKQKIKEQVDLTTALRKYRCLNILCNTKIHDYLCPLNEPLRPFLAIEYHREHLLEKNMINSARLTLDRDIRFWYQLADGTWIPLGNEHGIRLEIKCEPSFLNTRSCSQLIHLLQRAQAVPVLSKRYAGLNRLSMWQRSISPLPIDELPGFEYEIAFDVPEEKAQAIPAELYHLFTHTTDHFIIDPYRRWMSEWSMIRFYLGNSLRLNFYGDTFKWVWKTRRPQIHRQREGIKFSQEEKSMERLITPRQISYYLAHYRLQGALMRHKRQFWIRDKDERIYKISVHRSSNFTTRQYLTRLDLEYVGRAKQGDPHRALKTVTQRLRALACIIKKSFPQLKPATSSLRTFSWIHPKDIFKHPALQVLNEFMKLNYSKTYDRPILR
ncbi:MAG: hypothetical protein AB1352_03275 [Patescibacteria group bacterium]